MRSKPAGSGIARMFGGLRTTKLTSISFSVCAKHCLSGSWVGLSEQKRQRPPKPMSSRMSFSAAAARLPFPLPLPLEPDSIITVANLGFDVSVCNKPWADSSVAEFWQCRRVSSRMTKMVPALLTRKMISYHAGSVHMHPKNGLCEQSIPFREGR